MNRCNRQQTALISLLWLCSVAGTLSQQEKCECGYEASCQNGSCTCSPGFVLHSNGKDCKNETCLLADCLKCSAADVCVRCVKFIRSDNGECTDRCSGDAEIRTEGALQGNVCIPVQEESESKLMLGIVAGVGAGLVLCLIIIFVVCVYLRKTRKKVHLQSQQYKSPNMEMGNIKQYTAYDNQGFASEVNGEVKTGVIDPAVYSVKLEQLRPHTETLMQLLAQIRPKLRAMEPTDARVPTYKGVIHQLCRVLVLLHRKDSGLGSSIPSDALGLIEWAHQMLDDHRQLQELQQDTGPDVLGDLGHNKISYIDVDLDSRPVQVPAVYAEPGSRKEGGQQHRHGAGVSPYSSVPVPVPPATSKKPRTLATIHRTPSVPGTVNNNQSGGYTRPLPAPKPRPKSAGYFANGRYYDPSPSLSPPEVYAPASSYSDRSTTHLSTFVPDRPRSRSLSSSEPSSEEEGGVDGEEGSEGELDMFPFDPKDATEPVEV